MVNEQLRRRGIRDACVLAAMERIPRDRFVPDAWRAQAYDDRPLPIEAGQTISQPYVVAFMTEALGVDRRARVLEIGTGSGYQAAVLAECSGQVFTVEIDAILARTAAERLRSLGYETVRVRHGDGWEGWPKHAPYEAIMVTAAAPEIPPALIAQLGENGRLIMPRGKAGGPQVLIRARKVAGALVVSELLPVAFVPLVGGPDGGAAR
jgi:protein-L-isoaspartate(D-aspartate) O-methyltransferase